MQLPYLYAKMASIIKKNVEHMSQQPFAFQTHNPEEFSEEIAIAAPGVQINSIRGTRIFAHAEGAHLEQISMFKIQGSNFQVKRDPQNQYLAVTIPIQGSFVTESVDYHGHLAHILKLNKEFDLRTIDACQMLVCIFSEPFLTMQARQLDPDSMILLNGDKNLCMSNSNGRSFHRFLMFIYNETLRRDSLLVNPITITELEGALVSTLLLALEEQLRGRPVNHHDTLCAAYIAKAEEFIEANLCNAVTLADIVAVADVPSRTLRRAFTKHRGMSPICFLRTLRLERIHEKLRLAEPGSTSVTEVAMKYGFLELGRFAQYYKQQFGELPSQTLRK